MRVRTIGALLAFTSIGIIGTASVAAATDYPPTTANTPVSTAAVPTTTPPATTPPAGEATGLPFTGTDSTELFVVGAAIAAAGTLVLVRAHRGNRTVPHDT